MSGKRCKALRREFREKTGVSPAGPVTQLVERKGHIMGKFLSWLQMDVVIASEWRQIKKAYARRRAA